MREMGFIKFFARFCVSCLNIMIPLLFSFTIVFSSNSRMFFLAVFSFGLCFQSSIVFVSRGCLLALVAAHSVSVVCAFSHPNSTMSPGGVFSLAHVVHFHRYACSWARSWAGFVFGLF